MEIKKLAQVDTNHLFDSELEREFVGAFEKLSTAERPIRIHKTLVNEKEGYSLQVGESLWTIEPQVDFDASMGITVKSRPDFVIRPKRTTGNQKPIVVFTDGYYYHKDIVEDDTLKRMAIMLSGKYRVWSLTYKDVHNVFKSQGDYRTETLNSVKMPSGKVYKPAVKSANAEAINPEKESGFELLIDYLSMPNAEDLFAIHARSFAMSIVEASQMSNQVLYDEWKNKWNSVLKSIGSTDDVDDFGQAIYGTWKPRQDMGNIEVLGLQSQVYHYLGKTEEQKSVIGTYNRRVSRFFDKGIVATDKSLAMFIHENIEYNANNIDCWYNFEQEMKPLLNSAYEELQAKEVYVITAEEDQKDVK